MGKGPTGLRLAALVLLFEDDLDGYLVLLIDRVGCDLHADNLFMPVIFFNFDWTVSERGSRIALLI